MSMHGGKAFGYGTYLAEDSSKSDFYATPGATGLSCILVCRACLGKTHYATDFMPDITMPPDGKDSITALRRDEGGVAVDHREYIVYDRAQAVPEYRIWYRHAAGCECSKCKPFLLQ